MKGKYKLLTRHGKGDFIGIGGGKRTWGWERGADKQSKNHVSIHNRLTAHWELATHMTRSPSDDDSNFSRFLSLEPSCHVHNHHHALAFWLAGRN